MQRISRKTAKVAGLKYYFTGKPCKRGGHIDKRFVSSFCCVSCGREKASAAYDAMDSEQRKARYQERRDYLNRWKADNRERVLANLKALNKSRKETNPDYFREHYANNRERRKKESNEWYHANAERATEARKEYVAKNRDRARLWGRKSANTRRALKKQLFVEDVDPRVVFDRDGGICGICRERVDPMTAWEVDHIKPISKGGLHCYANVQLAHRKCNRSKGAKCAS